MIGTARKIEPVIAVAVGIAILVSAAMGWRRAEDVLLSLAAGGLLTYLHMLGVVKSIYAMGYRHGAADKDHERDDLMLRRNFPEQQQPSRD